MAHNCKNCDCSHLFFQRWGRLFLCKLSQIIIESTHLLTCPESTSCPVWVARPIPTMNIEIVPAIATKTIHIEVVLGKRKATPCKNWVLVHKPMSFNYNVRHVDCIPTACPPWLLNQHLGFQSYWPNHPAVSQIVWFRAGKYGAPAACVHPLYIIGTKSLHFF